MSNQKYDLLVIGSGPGGQRAAVQAAKLGKKVLVIEKDFLGGSCLHWGTVPSKTLREAVLRCKLQGHCDVALIQDAMKQTEHVIAEEKEIIAKQFARNQVEWVQGTASFLDAHTLTVKSEQGTTHFSASKIIVATGTRPNRPKDIPFDGISVFDSDTVLTLKRFPKRVSVMGAGVIGCEYVSIFAHMGSEVTLIDRRDSLLRGVDSEINRHLSDHFQKQKINCALNAQFSDFRLEPNNAGVSYLMNGERVVTDLLLVCMGRTGNYEPLNLPNAGLTANDRGLISVNEHYQTSQPHIYAVGDVIGSPALAASSEEQGRLAAAHAFGLPRGAFPTWFPYGIYTIPEISMVGPCEDELKTAGHNYVVGKAYYRELARGKILGDSDGMLKLIVDKSSRKLLAVHCIGTQATELIHIGQVAIAHGATIDFLVDNIFNYPTLAEAYKVAAYNAYNQLRP